MEKETPTEKESRSLKEIIKSITPKQKTDMKKFFIRLCISLLLITAMCALMYWRLSYVFTPEEVIEIKEFLNGMSPWGMGCLVGAIVLYIIGFMTFIHYKKKHDDEKTDSKTHKYILEVLICSLGSFGVVWSLFTDSILYNIYVYFLAFGLCWMFFKLFSMMKIKSLRKILSFPLAFLFRFAVPMMPVLIILMGAIHGMYQYDSSLLTNVANVFGTDEFVDINDGGSIGMILGYTGYSIFSRIYLIGESLPIFMLGVCVLATLILLYLTIYKHFIKGVPPMSFVDDATEAEAISSDEKIHINKDDKDDPILDPELLNIF